MSWVFATSLPTDGPGTSARMIYIDCALPLGSSASANTSTPIPPIQWVKLRHIIRLMGILSTSGSSVEPVVVKPDTVSNSASIKLGISPLITKGSAPNTDISIHAKATITKPSRA